MHLGKKKNKREEYQKTKEYTRTGEFKSQDRLQHHKKTNNNNNDRHT